MIYEFFTGSYGLSGKQGLLPLQIGAPASCVLAVCAAAVRQGAETSPEYN